MNDLVSIMEKADNEAKQEVNDSQSKQKRRVISYE